MGEQTNSCFLYRVPVTSHCFIFDCYLIKICISYKKEIEGIYRLRESTVVCAKCHLRIVIDVQQPGVKYCTCHDNKCKATSNQDRT